MTLLLIDWSSFFIKAGQFILAFSILVVLHELGHFLPAKWFKCRVEKFYLFFNPWFSLFKKKIGETEWGIGWVPFGGFVKISGMIDESMDKEQMKLPPQDYEFRSKKAWQRLIIMLGGIIVNILLAIVIFVGIMWHYGETYIPIENLKYGVVADTLGTQIGLQDGDKIVQVGNKKIDKVGKVGAEIIMQQANEIIIDRNGKSITLQIPKGFKETLNRNKLAGFTYVRYPLIVKSFKNNAALKGNDAKEGDRLIAYNDTTITYNCDFTRLTLPKDKVVTFTFLRNEKDTFKTQAYFDKNGELNVAFKSIADVLGTKHVSYSFASAIPAGWSKCWSSLANYVHSFKMLFQKNNEIKLKDSLGGIIGIANTFGDTWDWEGFWNLTAMFSIILAFMNLLPIPALDGGHALFCVIEIVTGRKPNDKFMEYAQTAGMILLLGFMVYALGLDFWRIFK